MYKIVTHQLNVVFDSLEDVFNFLPCGKAILKTPSGLCVIDRSVIGGREEYLGDIEVSEN